MRIILIIICTAAICLTPSCMQKDIFEQGEITAPLPHPVVGSVNTGSQDNFLLMRDKKITYYYDTHIYTRPIGTTFGSAISEKRISIEGEKMAAVSVGNRHFVIGHNMYGEDQNKNIYAINLISTTGEIGAETETGFWHFDYETFFGLEVGNRGFIFGQNNEGDHFWFLQEMDSFGKLGAETDRGYWHNFYKAATPFHINGKTYIFFQTKSSDNYWFISWVSPDGKLYDVCDGYWGDFWDKVNSVEMNGKTYLIGVRHYYNDGTSQYFIQRINEDGTLGAETDRGIWNNWYQNLTTYVYNGHAYLFGLAGDIQGNKYGYFIQEITEDGKMGAETTHGSVEDEYNFVHPFKMSEPSNFRYEIGWDLSKLTLNPARGWSSKVELPWTGDTKLSGGAALADIDKDGTQRYDAVLSGIQSLPGADRFYYQVAWNLDNTSGKPATWSRTFYGPDCGESQAGGGAAISDFDGNGVPDLVLMSVDDPDGPNSFWYYIGWNMRSDGQVTSWSDKFRVDGLGDKAAGGGAAIGDIDGNGKPDLVLMAVDDPQGENKFRYRIGKNLNNTGTAESWTPVIEVPVTLGTYSAGGGAALYDLDGNGKPELILMDIDSPKGPNPFWCYIGSDMDSNGNVTGWKGSGWNSVTAPPSLGDMTSGGGMAIKDINRNGVPDMLLMTIDNPYGND